MELACGREGVNDPDGDSEMGVETMMMGRFGSGGGEDVGVRPRDEVGVGGDWGAGGENELVKTGVATSRRGLKGSVWTEMDV